MTEIQTELRNLPPQAQFCFRAIAAPCESCIFAISCPGLHPFPCLSLQCPDPRTQSVNDHYPRFRGYPVKCLVAHFHANAP